MARRARALILLLLSTMLFALQGQTVVQCLCSGAITLGSAPEECCGECPDSGGPQLAATRAPSGDSTHAALSACDAACFHMATAESDQPIPAASHVDAPVPPVALLAEDPFIIDGVVTTRPSPPAWTRECAYRPAPTGPPCTILYGALLI